jgi:hypothetical protein
MARDRLARRGGRYPEWAHDGTAGAARRLHCDARAEVAPHNSLRSRCSLRSDKCGESDHEARAARAPTSALRFSSSHKSPTPGTAHRAETFAVFRDARDGGAGKAGGGCAPAATYAAPRSAGPRWARAQRALRRLTRRICPSAANAVSVASYAAPPRPEHRRGPGAKRRASHQERRCIPAHGFACSAAPVEGYLANDSPSTARRSI